ncbi:MAG: cyclase family protein [Syntrophorhabdaceae bacterium]|nr:cyclase family protein [Syntrophorhabdaceae bacterium]
MGRTINGKEIIDLSVPILPTPPEAMLKVTIEYSSHEEGAKRDGAFFGISPEDLPEGRFAAVEFVTLTTHSGTHLDAPYHYGPLSEGRPAKRIDEVPLEWCFGDGVVLDFTNKRPGDEIGIDDYKKALEKIDYRLKPFDIVLVMTGASRYYGTPEYPNMHPGNTRESTLWLIDQGIKVMGIDAWGWDRPFSVMVEEVKKGIKGRIWAAHFAGKEKEYCHIENLTNLDKIPRPYGFKVAVFPIKVPKAGGAWVRAVAIL